MHSITRYLSHGAILLIILGTALTLRIYGTTRFHPDEYQIIVQGKQMASDGRYVPTRFNYPSFYPMLQGIVSKYLPNLGRGIYGKEAERDVHHDTLRARFVTAILGTLTVLLVYLIGCSLGWPLAGLAGAAFLAVTFNHVENSQFATVDVPMTFNAVLAFLFICMHFSSGRALWAILGGVFCGLTIGTKYNGGIILVPFILGLIAVALRRGGLRAWMVVIAGLVAVPCGFLIAAPHFLSMYGRYIEGLRVQMRIYGGGFTGYDNHVGPNNWIWNTEYLLRAGVGVLPLALAIFGCVSLLFREKVKGLLVACFPLCYYPFICHQSVRITRNLTVLTPFLSLMAGYALWRITIHLFHWMRENTLATIFITAALIVAVFWQPFRLSYGYARMMRHTDPRTLAEQWAKTHMPKNSKIAVDFLWGPSFSGSTFRVTSRELGQKPLSWYLENGYDYIVTNSGYVLHWCPEAKPQYAPIYRELKDTFKEVATFSGNELGLRQNYYAVSTRPTITIYDLHQPRHSAVSILKPADGESVDRSSCDLRWSFSDEAPVARQSAYRVEVEKFRDGLIALEAEDLMEKAPSQWGWARRSHIPGYSGDYFLMANRKYPPLKSSFSVEKPGHYYCWARFWGWKGGSTTITVGSHSATLKRERGGWGWEPLGGVDLVKGKNSIVLDHAGEGHTVLDAFLFSADPAFDPNRDPAWVTVIDTGVVQSSETSVPPSLFSNLEAGLYRARGRAANEKGLWGPWSQFVGFRLLDDSNPTPAPTLPAPAQPSPPPTG
jgi:hypothetical protein